MVSPRRFLKKNANSSGVTLIEMMLVVTILGILTSAIVPKVTGMLVKTKEAKVRANLNALRSAISIYYADNDGFYPYQTGTISAANVIINSLLEPKYIKEVPPVFIPTGSSSKHDGIANILAWQMGTNTPHITEAGGYSYARNTGLIAIACQHADSRGVDWDSQ